MNECNICFHQFNYGEIIWKCNQCTFTTHINCITKWNIKHHYCPMCKLEHPILSVLICVKAKIQNTIYQFDINILDYINVLINHLHTLCKTTKVHIYLTHPSYAKIELHNINACTKILTLRPYINFLDNTHILDIECTFVNNNTYYLSCICNYFKYMFS